MDSQVFPINLDKLTAKERHNFILNKYVLKAAEDGESRKHKRDIDVIRENHRFLWDEDETGTTDLSWEQRLAQRYYRKLFKEYCIADLTRYKENKIALRWRTVQEVVTGIGQFQCGSRHCGERETLRTWEVNFKYIEHGEALNALVKLRLCPIHTEQLNYRTKKKEHKRQRHREKRELKEERRLKRRKLKLGDEEKAEEVPDKATEKDPNADIEEEQDANNGVASADEQVWSKQNELTQEQTTREQEFERYLEDLLL